MNEADRAEETAALYNRTALYKSRKPEPDAIATGECLFCGQTVSKARRWCNAECRDDWKKENERN